MKKAVYVFAVIVCCCLWAAAPARAGEIYLLVEFNPDRKSDVSPANYVRNALKTGGFIKIDSDVCEKVDANYPDKYSTDNNGRFYTTPAMMNFVGENGWKLRTVDRGTYIFVKEKSLF